MIRWRWSLILPLIWVFLLSGCSSRTSVTSPTDGSSPVRITNNGSDTMVNLALAWAEAYAKILPGVSVSVTGGGSGTGISSLINHSVDIANASREISGEEIELALKNGIEPKEYIVAKDAIAVIVNPKNPVNALTLQQISAIYSGKINNWIDVGGDDRIIVRLSRESNSGTHIYFLENVLRLGDKADKTLFTRDTLLLPSSQGITEEVKDNPNAIGYDGLGYVTADVKMIAVSPRTGAPYVLPSSETVNNGSYPIARDLYMYTAGEPTGALRQYLDWIYSSKAQRIVLDLGFVQVETER